jgi:hypothetical protein
MTLTDNFIQLLSIIENQGVNLSVSSLIDNALILDPWLRKKNMKYFNDRPAELRQVH